MQYSATHGWILSSDNAYLDINYGNKAYGFPIRCVK